MKKKKLNKYYSFLKHNRVVISLILLSIFLVPAAFFLFRRELDTSTPTDAASETYKLWEEITLEFTGNHSPLGQTSSNPNPFLDYRLTVTLINGSKSYTVPGYFVGDGNGGAGTKYRAHFSAETEGIWTYTATLQTGVNVAVDGGGSAVSVTPASGTITVSGQSNLQGLYSTCGKLKYVGEHYLRCAKTGTSWIKGGTNSPENLLAGADTGNEANIKTVLDYLGSQGVNSIYFLPNNIGGDGKGDTHPFAFNYVNVPSITEDNLLHYSVSRLNKWNEIFKYAASKNITLEFVLNEEEDENRLLLGESLTVKRKLFYRELIARFAHHPGVRWIITEENEFVTPVLDSFSQYIRSVDPYDNRIAVHTPRDAVDFYVTLVNNPNYDSGSIQFSTIKGSADNASTFTETWRQNSAAAGRPWVIELDEAIVQEDSRYGMTKENMDDLRRRVLYPGYFSGANISWYYGFDQDLGMSLWKFQDREPMWKWMGYARNLLEQFPNIASFKPGDELITSQTHSGGKTQVYYYPGQAYLIYMAKTVNGENAKINLSSAIGKNLSLQWFNPRTGIYEGSPQPITASANFALSASPKAASGDRDDWVVVIKSDEIVAPPGTKAFHEKNGLIVIQPENHPVASGWTIESTLSGYTGSGYKRWTGADIPPPGVGLNEYKLYVTNPGRYEIRLRSNKTNLDNSEGNDVWLKIDDGTWYKTYNGAQEIKTWVWNTEYEIEHHVNTPAAYAELTAGLHTLYISGRSYGFYIDRIHFYLPSVTDALNTSLPESEYKELSTPGISCNSVCTSDAQCSSVNSEWYCATQFSNQNWIDGSAGTATIQYKDGNEVKTESGPTTDLNIRLDASNVLHQHLVKNGKIFYRKNTPGVGWDTYWIDLTTDVVSVGCNFYPDCGGKIIGFNSSNMPDGSIQQHILRSNNIASNLFTRNNSNGWSAWSDVTSNITSVGSGLITSFTSVVHRDGYIAQNLTRGGKVYERTNLAGWGNWIDVSDNFTACAGTGVNKCGTGTIISFERGPLQDNSDVFHLFRENNKAFSRKNIPADERCRAKNNPWSAMCEAASTPIPTTTLAPTATLESTPIPTTTPAPTATPESTLIPTTATPSKTPVATITPSSTITVPSPAPSSNNTPTPSVLTSPTITINPTPPVPSIQCGTADLNGNGRFDIYDFGALHIGFAALYNKNCSDTPQQQAGYGSCGGKDVDKNGKTELFDLSSFAGRYVKTSCALL